MYSLVSKLEDSLWYVSFSFTFNFISFHFICGQNYDICYINYMAGVRFNRGQTREICKS